MTENGVLNNEFMKLNLLLLGFLFLFLHCTNILGQKPSAIIPEHQVKRTIKSVIIESQVKKAVPDWSIFSDVGMHHVLAKIKVGDSVEVTGWAPWSFSIRTKDLNGYISFRALPFWTNTSLDSLASVMVQQSPIEEATAERNKKELEEKENEQLLKKKFGNTTAQKIINGRYWIGMTNEMAEYSLGKPSKINRTVTSNSVNEQWVYSSVYLYFVNGFLESFQDQR